MDNTGTSYQTKAPGNIRKDIHNIYHQALFLTNSYYIVVVTGEAGEWNSSNWSLLKADDRGLEKLHTLRIGICLRFHVLPNDV